MNGKNLSDLLQAENVLHVEEAVFLVGYKSGGSQAALCVSRTACGFVGDFDSFARTCKKNGMVADDVPATDCRKTDG